MHRGLITALVVPLLVATALPSAATPHRASPVRFDYLGETELPHGLQYRGTTVGGLSAISWDRRTGDYLLISDDRSATGPARFYSAAISARRGAVSVRLTGTHAFTQPDGSTFPPTSTHGAVVAPDPEGTPSTPDATGSRGRARASASSRRSRC